MVSIASPRITPPLKWHGGKHYLAPWIVEHMPKHTHYVEPFFGGGAVLLARDPEGVSEVVNDLDGQLTTFWSVLRDPELFERFRRMVEATPFSERLWKEAHQRVTERCDSVELAFWFFVHCRQSLSGRRKDFASISRTRTRRGMNEQASAWLTAVEGLPQVHARLKRVTVLNRPALDVIRSQDGPGTLFYLDPPYLGSTRTSADAYGAYEMSEAEHVELLELLQRIRGKVILSGYPSELYDDLLAGWHRHDRELPNNAAGGKTKRRMVECLWCNFSMDE